MNNLVYYILLAIFALSNTAGGLLMKLGSQKVAFGQGESIVKTLLSMATNWQLVLGVGFYGFSFVLATLVYTKISLNVAYPIMMASSFLLISIASVVLFKESFVPVQILGSLLVIIGIVMVAANMAPSASSG
jgi:multidrug transporter EmrE-like cation transporter